MPGLTGSSLGVPEGSGLLGAARRGFGRVRVFAVLAFRGFLHDDGLNRASALAFDTALGIVPLLAFVVAVLKGFGGYDDLVTHTLRPLVDGMLGNARGAHGAITLRGAFLELLEFVNRTDFSALGTLGVIALLYVVVLLLVSVEAAMNAIFAVGQPRSILRRTSDYSAILFITPVCGMLVGAVATAAGNVDWPFATVLLRLVAIVFASVGFAALYLVMPYTRVRLGAAAVGGVVAAVLFYLILLAHVELQIGVARYNAIYSTFAAIPLFLIWVFTSWLVVLYGAELTAAISDVDRFCWKVGERHVNHITRQYAALRAMTALCSAFIKGTPAPTTLQIARATQLPPPLVEHMLERLAVGGIVVKTMIGDDVAWVPGRELDKLYVSTILDCVDYDGDEMEPNARSASDEAVTRALSDLRRTRCSAECDHSLRELVDADRS